MLHTEVRWIDGSATNWEAGMAAILLRFDGSDAAPVLVLRR